MNQTHKIRNLPKFFLFIVAAAILFSVVPASAVEKPRQGEDILRDTRVADKRGLKPPSLSSSAEEVLAQLFLRKPGENHFASAELRRFAVLRHARNAIGTAAAIVLAAGVAYGGWNVSGALQNREVDLQTARRIQAAQREFDEITRSTPALGVGGQTMRDTVAFFSGALRHYPTVSTFLVPVSAVLDRYPAIRLTQVVWEAADDDKTLPVIMPTIPRVSPPLKALRKGAEGGAGAPPRPAGEAQEKPFSSGRNSVAVLEAMVDVQGMDYRDMLSEHIAHVAAVTVGAVRVPIAEASRFGIRYSRLLR